MISTRRRTSRLVGFVAVAAAVACLVVPAAQAAPGTHLFILSGQSNMAGLNPNLSFSPTVKEALAGDKVLIIKDAQGGQPIRRWYKKWHAPKDANVPAGAQPWGDLYDRMMGKVKAAIGDSKPDTVTFVWMQGESDAAKSICDIYFESFRGVIAQLKADLNRDDINVVIGRISDYKPRKVGSPYWDKIREVQVKLAEADPRTEWVDTDDLNGPNDGLHYTKEGYVELGKRFADKALALIAAGGKPGKAGAALAANPVDRAAFDGADKPWFFIVAADPQLSGKQIDEDNWAAAIKQFNRLKPDFVVVCGDLTFGSGKSEDRLKPQALDRDEKLADAYNKIVAGLDKSIRLYNVAGNHDVGQNPSPETLKWYGKRFGMPCYIIRHKGGFFVTVESNLLRDGSAAPKLADDQLAWLKNTLAEAKAKPYNHRVVFSHHPLYVASADEKDAYWNYPAARRKEMLSLFHDARIEYVFSGHLHKNNEVADGDMQMLTTTTVALGPSSKANPHGVRIVKVYPDRIEQKFYTFEDLPEKVELEAK